MDIIKEYNKVVDEWRKAEINSVEALDFIFSVLLNPGVKTIDEWEFYASDEEKGVHATRLRNSPRKDQGGYTHRKCNLSHFISQPK